MLKRMSNWMDKPWTNGTYVKLCAIVGVIYAALWVGVVVWLKWSAIVEKFTDCVDTVKNFFSMKITVHKEDEAD